MLPANASREVHAMLTYSICRPARMLAAKKFSGESELQQPEAHSFSIDFNWHFQFQYELVKIPMSDL
jgi:hypothetical protein